MALCIHAGRRWHTCSWRTGKGKLGAAWRGWNPPDTGRCRSALKTGEHAAWTNENLNFGNTRQCLRVTRPYRGAQRRPYRGAQRKPGPTPRRRERARPPCAGFARRQIGSGSGKRNSRPAAGTVRSTLDGTGYGQRKSSLPVCSDAAVVFMSSRRPQECPRMGFPWSERPIWVHAFGRTSGLAWKAVWPVCSATIRTLMRKTERLAPISSWGHQFSAHFCDLAIVCTRGSRLWRDTRVIAQAASTSMHHTPGVMEHWGEPDAVPAIVM